MRICNIAAAGLLLVGGPAFAQDEPARKAAVEVAARVPFEKAMKGAPYSAETVVEGTQTLADGNRINRKTSGRVYRDGEGRTRREEDVTLSAVTGSGRVSGIRTTISIVDPIAGFSYSLDTANKIAWRTPAGGVNAIMGRLEANMAELKEKLAAEERVRSATPEDRMKVADEQKMRTAMPTPAAGAGGGGGGRGGGVMASAGAGGRGRIGDPVTLGPLEHKTMEGVAVEGRKTTTTIPAGQIGNEQPITITSEEWRSRELNLLVLTRHSDPRTGESTYRLQNIVRAEPDQSLFMVPSDYTVKETGIRKMVEDSVRKH